MSRSHRTLLSIPALVASAALAACSGGAAGAPDASSGLRSSAASHVVPGKKKKPKIQHVVIIMQENRSFDNLFQGYPGANTQSWGLNSKGQTIALQPVGLEAPYGIDHRSAMFFAACDGYPQGQNCKMDGFDQETTYGAMIPSNPEYGYVPPNETKIYFSMANQYALADDMFTSHIDASFVSHQYIIAGQAGGTVDLPSGSWGCGGTPSDKILTLNQDRSYGPSTYPCFDYTTLADEVDAAGLDWRFYSSAAVGSQAYYWSSYQAVNHIYNSPLWTSNVVTPSKQFITDVGNGTLANVTWIMPEWINSDHATSQSKTGPDWVASLVNAVGQSKFWKASAIFIMWDEWGGWYDHVPPPYVNYDGLGFRVPLLMISPYAKHGYVSHVQYEHGSILRYVEDNFGLAQLAASDARANDPAADSFDYTQKPRKFRPFSTNVKTKVFMQAPVDPRPPDEE